MADLLVAVGITMLVIPLASIYIGILVWAGVLLTEKFVK